MEGTTLRTKEERGISQTETVGIDVIQNQHVQVMWFQWMAQNGAKPTLQKGPLEMVGLTIHVI